MPDSSGGRATSLNGWVGRLTQSSSAVVSAGATSLTGFAVNAAVSRRVDSADFGRFSVVYLVLYFSMASLRALFGEPLLLVARRSDEETQSLHRWAVGSSSVSASALGLAVGVVLVSILRSPWLFAACAVLPLLVVQDALRFVAFALARPHIAAASDVAVLVPLPLLFVWHPRGLPIEVFAVGLWAISCAVSASLTSRWVLNGLPTIEYRRYWDQARSAAVGSVTEFAATAMVSIIPVILIPLATSLDDAATVRVLQMVFSPITIVHAAGFSLMAPRLTRRARASGRGMGRLLSWYALALSGCSIVLTIVLIATPQLGSWLFPSSYSEARSALSTYLVVQLTGVGVGTVTLGLRATDSYGRLAAVRIVTAAMTPVAAVIGVRAGGVRGFCVAVAAMQLPVLVQGLRLLGIRQTPRGSYE